MPTPEQLEEIRERIKEAEEKLRELDEELTLAERADLADPSRREAYNEAKTKLQKIKIVYGV